MCVGYVVIVDDVGLNGRAAGAGGWLASRARTARSIFSGTWLRCVIRARLSLQLSTFLFSLSR